MHSETTHHHQSLQYAALKAIADKKSAAADVAAIFAFFAALDADSNPGDAGLAAAAAAAAAEYAVAFAEYTAATAALSGASQSASYKVTTRFYRRLLGSTGPYIFFSYDERTITYSDLLVPTPAETPWIDVPNDAGWETIVGGQTVELLP